MPKDYNPLYSIDSFIKNSFALLSVKILDPFASFIVVILISRYAGASPLGIYIIAYNLYSILNSIALLGLNNFVMREIGKDKSWANTYFVNIAAIGFITSIFCFMLIYFIIHLLNYPYEIRGASYIIGLALVPAIWMQLCEAEFVALGKAKYFLFAVIIEALSKIFLSALVLSLGLQISVLMAAIAASKVLGLVTSLYFLVRFIGKLCPKIDFSFCKKIIKEVVPIFLSSIILVNILIRIDVVILSKFRGIKEVGWYGLASKFMWIISIFITTIIITIFPIISNLIATNRSLFKKFCARFLAYITILVFLIIMVAFILSDSLIMLLFGRAFTNSIIALKILVWSLLPAAWAGFCGYTLIAGNRQKLDLYAFSIALSSSLIAHFFLSSRIGYIGTSIAVLISLSILAISEYFFVHKYIVRFNILQIVSKPFISIAFAGVFIFLFREKLNQWFLAISSSVIYFLCLFFLKAFSREDILLFGGLRKHEIH